MSVSLNRNLRCCLECFAAGISIHDLIDTETSKHQILQYRCRTGDSSYDNNFNLNYSRRLERQSVYFSC